MKYISVLSFKSLHLICIRNSRFFNALSSTLSFKCVGNIYTFSFVVRLLNVISSPGVCLNLSGFPRHIKTCDIWVGVASYKLPLATLKICITTIMFWIWQPPISQVITKVLENVFYLNFRSKVKFLHSLSNDLPEYSVS